MSTAANKQGTLLVMAFSALREEGTARLIWIAPA
jgi:hypothetical protein